MIALMCCLQKAIYGSPSHQQQYHFWRVPSFKADPPVWRFLHKGPRGRRARNSPMAAKHRPRIGPKYFEKLDPADVSSLNELLDRIAALGVSTDYDQVGHKSDQREINHPQIAHLVAVIEEPAKDTSLPILKTKYVRVSESPAPDTTPLDRTLRPPYRGSSEALPEPSCLTRPKPVASEIVLAPNTDMGQDPNFNPPTHHNLYSPSNSGPPDI